MAASLATLYVLALHCAPAAATRDDVGATRAALAAGDAKLDSAAIGKEGEASCVCILKKVEKAETTSHFDQQDECIQECPKLCNSDYGYKYSPVKADQDDWWGSQDVLPDTPFTASSCEKGECKCLNMTGWKKEVDAFRSRKTDFEDIVELQKKYSSHDCLKECPAWCDRTTWNGYCLNGWDQLIFLAQDNKCKNENRGEPLGLVSCHHMQFFKISKNAEEDGQYTVELDMFHDENGDKEWVNVGHDVVRFEAEGSKNHETRVDVGFPRMKGKIWSVSTEGKLYKWNWRWKVEDGGEKRFIIEETANKKKWEAKEVVSGTETVRYYAKKDSKSEEEKFTFHSDSRKKAVAGLTRTATETQVWVAKEEDAGLIVMTSVLIIKGLKGLFR